MLTAALIRLPIQRKNLERDECHVVNGILCQNIDRAQKNFSCAAFHTQNERILNLISYKQIIFHPRNYCTNFIFSTCPSLKFKIKYIKLRPTIKSCAHSFVVFLIHSSVKLDGNESLFAESDITYLTFTPQKCENKFAAAIKHHNRTRLVIQFCGQWEWWNLRHYMM